MKFKTSKSIFVLFIIFSVLLSCLVSCSSGKDGKNGTAWHYGEGKPTSSLQAQIGDFYFETDDCDIYTLTESGWVLLTNIRGVDGEDGKDGKDGKDGANGKDGATWLSGSSNPKSTDGKNGDFWLNTNSMRMFLKTEGKWSFVTEFSKQERNYDYMDDGELKILCIGNSYSVDTMQYVYQIAKDLDVPKITLGNLYIGGCSIETHYQNATNDIADYTYFFNNNGSWVTTPNYTIKQAAESENWDYISFQQNSGNSGTPSTFTNLQALTNIIREMCPDAEFFWHMTWAYQKDSEKLTESIYKNDQQAMYSAIISTVKCEILTNETFEFVAPVGTAIQNARTSYIGDNLNRDGTHLTKGLGRYIAGLTLLGECTGLDISETTWKPNDVSESEQIVAIECAVNALEKPYQITESDYKTQP